MTHKIYQFDSTGRLIQEFNSPRQCYTTLGLQRERISAICRLKTLVNKEYYLSYEPKIDFIQPKEYKERLAKRSNIECEPNINDFNILTKYRDNLILSFNDISGHIDQQRVSDEVINLTRKLCY